MLTLFAPTGVGEIHTGDDLGDLVLSICELEQKDVVVVTSKVVSKAEGMVVALDPNDPDAFEKLVLSQSKRVLRRRGSLLITETHHGFVCANAGIDQSNVLDGFAVLLPRNPDLSARRIKKRVTALGGPEIAVIISDTFGRTWRNGVTDVAIGCAGIAPIIDMRGSKDSHGRTLQATEIAVADEIAAAAELVKPKAAATPFVVVRGIENSFFRRGSVANELVRKPAQDLFR